jgi:hypothetical protein
MKSEMIRFAFGATVRLWKRAAGLMRSRRSTGVAVHQACECRAAEPERKAPKEVPAIHGEVHILAEHGEGG